MARFKRLTAAEARTLTRHELIDRIEREQAYWHRKPWHRMSVEDQAAEREFRRIMHAAIDPIAGLDDAIAYVKGERVGESYWNQRPDVPDKSTQPGDR